MEFKENNQSENEKHSVDKFLFADVLFSLNTVLQASGLSQIFCNPTVESVWVFL